MQGRNYYAGNCETGQLTNKGWTQEQDTGAMYRRVYVESGFLPSSFDPSITYMRSDQDDRCVQSLQTMLEGFFPSSASSPQLDIFDINTLDKYYDNISPNSNVCPILKQYYNEAFLTPEWITHNDKFTLPLFAKLTKALGYPVTSISTFNQIHDCLCVHVCNEQPIPSGVTPALYNAVMAEFEYQYHTIYNYPTPVANAQAGIGFFLDEIKDYMLAIVNNSTSFPQYKLTLWSGHDTTLVPLLVAFNQWNGVWAQYASQMQFEIYRSRSQGTYSIRVAYDGKNLILPGCETEVCDWNTFYSFLLTILPNGNC
jgi:acid phosphatase